MPGFGVTREEPLVPGPAELETYLAEQRRRLRKLLPLAAADDAFINEQRAAGVPEHRIREMGWGVTPLAELEWAGWCLWFDGASLSKTREAGARFVLRDPEGQKVVEEGVALGNCTNNEAEYRALILGIKAALRLGVQEL